MKTLVVYLILSAMVLNISPGKNYRRYIALFTGLVLIIMLARPVSGLLKTNGDEVFQSINSYMVYDGQGGYNLSDILEAEDTAYDLFASYPSYGSISKEEGLRRSLAEHDIRLQKVELTKDREGNIIRCIVYVSVIKNVEVENETSIHNNTGVENETSEYNTNLETDISEHTEQIIITKTEEIYELSADKVYIVYQ